MSQSSWLKTGLSVAACIAIVVVALGVVGIIYLTEPESEREGAVRRTAMLVEVSPVEHGTFHPELVALGTVRATQRGTLQPRVSGQVTRIADDFVPGRVVDAGDMLFQIDPADARNDKVLAESALAQAQADFALERGRQAVARAERDQITGPLSEDQEALILRQPQLRSAQARVESAEAAARQAQLDLSRTTVRAPFRALVLERTTDLGSQVSPSSVAGQLIGVDQFWVELTLPARRLSLLPTGDDVAGVPVRIRDRAAWEPDTWRTARLDSIVPQVDGATRMARLFVAVDDPLSLSTDAPELFAGAFVEARVQASPLTDVVRIPSAWLRAGDTVWEMQDDMLRIRSVEVVVEDAEYAYIREGLSQDALVVTTDLSTVTDGAPLRTEAL